MVSTSAETQGGKTGLPTSVSGRHVVRRRQSSPILECAQVTGKAGENGQHSGNRAAAHPGQDRRLPGVVTHSRPQRVPARSSLGTTKVARGRYRLGHRLVRTLSKSGDGSMYSQAYVSSRCIGLSTAKFERSCP